MPKTNKADCLKDLRLRVLSTDLAPGLDLDEVALSARYGMSRTPLREVLQRLQGEGYVVISENRGAKVASMDLAVLRTFFQTAPMVYANIARLAAESRTMGQLEALKATQARFTAATREDDPAEAAIANHDFHAVIGDMAHNPYLSAALARLQIDHTRMSQTFYRPAAPSEARMVRRAVAQHDAMIAAIAAQDAALVVDLTLQHWDLSRDRMEEFVRPDPLPVDLPAPKDDGHAI